MKTATLITLLCVSACGADLETRGDALAEVMGTFCQITADQCGFDIGADECEAHIMFHLCGLDGDCDDELTPALSDARDACLSELTPYDCSYGQDSTTVLVSQGWVLAWGYIPEVCGDLF